MIIQKELLTKQECIDILKDLTGWKQGASRMGKSHKNNSEMVHDKHSGFIYNKILQHPTLHYETVIKNLTKPRFNSYDSSGQFYHRHVDFFLQEGLRTDLSFTLFLTEPDSYEGGELCVGGGEYKLPAGHIIIYPSGQIHEVLPVTSGVRIAAIGWIQSYIEDAANRQLIGMLAKMLDRDIELKTTKKQRQEDMVQLSCIYNQLLKKWS